MEIDVLVIGMGPAGSGAATAAAAAGAKVLAVDRKREIGTPVQCGEVIGRSLLLRSGLRLPRQAVSSTQDHTRFHIGRELTISNHGEQWASVTVERKILDKLLAARAAAAGASVLADSALTSLSMDGDRVMSATIRVRGVEVEVEPRTVVAADGVHSTVAKMTGVCWNDEDMVARGVEFEMVSKRPLPRCMQIFLEEEVGLGYGWIIPKGRDRANVGLAELGLRERSRQRAMGWIEDNPVVSSYFDGDSVLEVKTGDAPVPGFQGGPTRGNVLYAGDAAGQTLAFVGEGIIPAYLCGLVAGEAAALDPDSYDGALREAMGEELGYGGEVKDAILGIWHDRTLDARQRYLAAGLLMSEAVPPGELEALAGTEGLDLAELRRMLSGSPGLKVSRMRRA